MTLIFDKELQKKKMQNNTTFAALQQVQVVYIININKTKSAARFKYVPSGRRHNCINLWLVFCEAQTRDLHC